jgi:hypothetical protein
VGEPEARPGGDRGIGLVVVWVEGEGFGEPPLHVRQTQLGG